MLHPLYKKNRGFCFHVGLVKVIYHFLWVIPLFMDVFWLWILSMCTNGFPSLSWAR